MNEPNDLEFEQQEPSPEQQYRAGAYGLLGTFFRRTPDQELLENTANLSTIPSDEDELTTAMQQLGQACQNANLAAVDDEFHDLFIGVGRGEVVPYGSWYLTGFLMEKPLGELRQDLDELGFEREPGVKEPEDHIAALCEVMGMLIMDNEPVSEQAKFFNKHMAVWLDKFFTDLAEAESVNFYQAVANFGAAFIAFERQYFGLEIQE